MSHFEGHFEGAKTFDPLNCPERSEGQFMGQKSLGPLKMVERPHSIRGGPGSIPGRCSSIFGIWREVL